jgi:hypothetical protein
MGVTAAAAYIPGCAIPLFPGSDQVPPPLPPPLPGSWVPVGHVAPYVADKELKLAGCDDDVISGKGDAVTEYVVQLGEDVGCMPGRGDAPPSVAPTGGGGPGR